MSSQLYELRQPVPWLYGGFVIRHVQLLVIQHDGLFATAALSGPAATSLSVTAAGVGMLRRMRRWNELWHVSDGHYS